MAYPRPNDPPPQPMRDEPEYRATFRVVSGRVRLRVEQIVSGQPPIPVVNPLTPRAMDAVAFAWMRYRMGEQ